MKKLRDRYNSWSWETRLLIVFALISLIPAFATLWPSAPVAGGPVDSVDTHIPKGFVLIPIEVQNYEALDSILGRFGLVDLFIAGEKGLSQQPVAVNVRLLRAPQNPSRFAVLVPEAEASKILSHSGSYAVIVKRPGPGGTEFVKQQIKPKRKIVYEGG